MKFRRRDLSEVKVELQMTPMIDCVFLLLIFFIVTFKVSAQEGDFNVKMPLAAAGGGPPPDFSKLPLKLRLQAGADGQLAEIVLNENLSFGTDFNRLRQHVLQLVGDTAGPSKEEGPEVEIDADFSLRYVHLIEAITAVTGYRQGKDVIRLIDRIKFSPPRK